VDPVAGGYHLDKLLLELEAQTGNAEAALAHGGAGSVLPAHEPGLGALALQAVQLGRRGGVLVVSLELKRTTFGTIL
jgi:hypothetical protein